MNRDDKNTPVWGPENPHPLSRMQTELVWEGKYDEYGNRRPIKLPTSTLPLQRIETIDEPRDREKAVQMGMFDEDAFTAKSHRDDFRNMLIWGDNKLALSSLLETYKASIDLIYIDPPFDVGADFTMEVELGENKESVQKEQSILEAVAYRDTWGKGTDSYLHMMYERISLIKDLLSKKGSIYVHCDWRVAHYLKLILDDVFGVDCLRNEIIWQHQQLGTPRTNPSRFAKAHETILWYSRTADEFILNYQDSAVRVPWSEHTKKSMRQDEDGRWYYERRRTGTDNPWAYDPRFLRTYVDDPEAGKTASDVWSDMPSYQPMNEHKTGYNTQKPNELIKRIVAASSNKDSLVADFFCGSGTTLAVAEELGRKWIGVDLGRYAIHTARKRLIQVQRELHEKGQPYRSFDVYNLGRYERQWWQLDRLKGADVEHRNLVIKFYKAAALQSMPHPLLHGTKHGAYVYIDQIDSILTFDELRSVARAAQSTGGRELHCLAWEFEMELALKKQAIEAETGLLIRLKYIPREIMESNRTEIQFFEAGYLEARPIKKGKKIDVELIRFTPSLVEAPEKEVAELRKRAIQSPFDFIDFWAIDFEWRDGKPFEHHWQDFRTRNDRSLKTHSDIGWEYVQKGKRAICVKVIDVFGVDTTTVIEVEI